MAELRYTVVVQRGKRWAKLEKTRFTKLERAQAAADKWQREFPDETVRVRQHPAAKVSSATVVTMHRLDPIQHPRPILVNDLLPADLLAFDNGGIDEYWESARWGTRGDILVTWNADDVGYETLIEDQYGQRKSQSASARTMIRALESVSRD